MITNLMAYKNSHLLLHSSRRSESQVGLHMITYEQSISWLVCYTALALTVDI